MEWAWVVAVVMVAVIVLLVVLVLRRNTADDRRTPENGEPAPERREYPTGWNRSTGEMRDADGEGDPPAPRGDA
ncbi:hypothetical protein ACFVWN_21755 [Nocardiopsis flavescens]|uniref:Uncharacterized protein n=1 Tax=Nocardiopsis flavescens TaxID=758803 RepID=A0A1M6HEM2_9ACTN|nr:hypothetical protein [Nocardiopsis flavescens]SHJ20655.1 hypothetical protein SAMN05421803_104155 [Nocardiopsis flavescens]